MVWSSAEVWRYKGAGLNIGKLLAEESVGVDEGGLLHKLLKKNRKMDSQERIESYAARSTRELREERRIIIE